MGSSKQQLCWGCKNATGGCSWADNLKPVEGWDAKPTTIRNYSLGVMKYQKSEHGGLCYAKSMLYKKYGKKRDELTAEEVREYNRLKQREHRSKSKITPDIFKTDGVKHIKITWGK